MSCGAAGRLLGVLRYACSDVTSAVIILSLVVREMGLGRYGGCAGPPVVHNDERLVYADHIATPDTPRHTAVHRCTMPPANRGRNRGRLQTSQANYLRMQAAEIAASLADLPAEPTVLLEHL